MDMPWQPLAATGAVVVLMIALLTPPLTSHYVRQAEGGQCIMLPFDLGIGLAYLCEN
ncbi:MAG TPA: hypothetical protein VMT72_16665 [Pseudolabrys sp.]|nr:hypothetical protein [Pseudolabrys sp.]